MNRHFPRHHDPQPAWHETELRSERGQGGSDIFQQVHYVDLLDKAEGRASVRSLHGVSDLTDLSVVTSTGHEIGLEEDRGLTLLLPLSGLVFSATGASDLVARPGQAMFLPRGKRRTVTSVDGSDRFRAIVLLLPELPQPRFLRSGLVTPRSAQPDLDAAARLLFTISAAPPRDIAALGDLAGSARTLVAGAIGAIGSGAVKAPRLPASEQSLFRAESLMREFSSEEVSIGDIADASGISLRQLQDLFRRRHGLSPHAFLTRLRLEEAHRRLKGSRTATTVTEAALLAGFNHLGRFPGLYRARFGRLPSQTRAALP